MPLPVLTSHREPPREDLVRLFHKTEAMWTQHLAEPETLDFATAYANASLAGVWDANHVADVALPEGVSPDAALRQVEEHFTSRGTRCFYWVMNPSAPPRQTQPMAEHLLAQGCRAVADDILYLRRMPALPVARSEGLQIIPARASYRHSEQLARLAALERWKGPEALVEARMLHLDDPHWDALIALKDGQAVAGVGVLAVGELGRIEHLYVAPQFRRQGIGRTMMIRALEICARSLFRHIFIFVEPGNVPGQALYARLGFEKIGQMTVYRVPDAVKPAG